MHIAVLLPAFPSHLAAAEALAAALAQRGHRLTLVARPEVAGWLRPGSPLGFRAVSGPDAPLDRLVARAARPSFPFGTLGVIRDMARATLSLCRAAPEALAAIGAEAVLADQMEPAGALVADRLGLPFVSLAAALPLEPDPLVPPPMLAWRYDPSERGVRRNAGGRRVAARLMRPVSAVIAAEAAPGRPRASLEDCLSPAASLWQLVPSLDYPRASTPAHCHCLGPLRLPEGEVPALPFAPRGGRPLVYASLGTLQGHRLGLFRRIARACRRAGAELVVSHCGRLSAEEAARIDADHVLADLPQRATIARADLVVTHAGLNTVLDAAEAGKPMLGLPIAFDQPGTASRLARSGAGIVLDHRFATAGRLALALARLLDEPGFAAASRRIGAEIAAAGGAERGADIVERALSTGGPAARAAA